MIKNIIKILLVEDDPSDAEFIKDALYEFILKKDLFHMENGADALDFIFKKRRFELRKEEDMPTLILLDLKSPKINGLEVLQIIKADENTKSIPVVIVTSSREEKDILNCYKYGANSFIVKPIDYKAFQSTIKAVGEYWIRINQL